MKEMKEQMDEYRSQVHELRVELSKAEGYWQTSGLGSSQAATDLAWALINSMEFLYRH